MALGIARGSTPTLRAAYILLLALSLLVANTRSASACVCDNEDPPVPDALRQSSAVFTGTVLDMPQQGGLVGRLERGQGVVFQVDAAWKGVSHTRVTVWEPYWGGTACEWKFTQGARYLVYAQSDGDDPDGRLRTTHCNSSKPIEGASEDVRLLGPPMIPQVARSTEGSLLTPSVAGAACAVALIGYLGARRAMGRFGRR